MDSSLTNELDNHFQSLFRNFMRSVYEYMPDDMIIDDLKEAVNKDSNYTELSPMASCVD